MSSDSDDEPQLSAHALAALKEFYTENQASAESNAEQMPSENWVCKTLAMYHMSPLIVLCIIVTSKTIGPHLTI